MYNLPDINLESLETLLSSLKSELIGYVKDQYEDIENNFEPDKIVPIKRMKARFSEDGIKDLNKAVEREQELDDEFGKGGE